LLSVGLEKLFVRNVTYMMPVTKSRVPHGANFNLLGDNLMSGYQFILALSSVKFLGVYPAIVVFLCGNVLGIVRA
jgi:hypothetical protein